MNAPATQNPEVPAKIEAPATRYFSPAELDKAQEAIEKAAAFASENSLPLLFNWNTDEELPAGYSLHVRSMSERGKELPYAVAVFALPTLETLYSTENGQSWAADVVAQALAAKASNVIRVAASGDNWDGTVSGLPLSVDDFITRASKADESKDEAFNAFVSGVIEALKKKGIPNVTKRNVRLAMSSKAAAAALFPGVNDKGWVMGIDALISKGESSKKDTAGLVEWKASRDNTEYKIGNVDEDLFADLFGPDEAPESDQEAAASDQIEG